MDVDTFDGQPGRLFDGVADFVDNALGDFGDVHAVNNTDVLINDQLAVLAANTDTLVGKRPTGEDGTQALTGAALDHAGDTEAGRGGVTDEIRKIILRNLDDAQMIFDTDHTVNTPFCAENLSVGQRER